MRFHIFGIVAALALAIPQPAHADVLTFDDWPANTNPAGYGPIRFEFGGFVVAQTPAQAAGLVSGNQELLWLGDGTIGMDFFYPVDLHSLYVTSLNPTTTSITFFGHYADGSVVRQDASFSSTSPTFVEFGTDWQGLVSFYRNR